MQSLLLRNEFQIRRVLDALEFLHETDPMLFYRYACREDACGSDGININGKNGLACISRVSEALGTGSSLIIKPLPRMLVIRDLVVDQSLFFLQYQSIKPWFIKTEPAPAFERYQSPDECAKLDGLYECILCGCCSSQCPSWWWNSEKSVGSAGRLQAWRFVIDSRDKDTAERLQRLQYPFSLFRCRSIGNCSWVCSRGLNPMGAIGHICQELLRKSTWRVARIYSRWKVFGSFLAQNLHVARAARGFPPASMLGVGGFKAAVSIGFENQGEIIARHT